MYSSSSIRIDISRVKQQIDVVKILLESVEISPRLIQTVHRQIRLDRLHMIVIIVPPAPHREIHVVHLVNLVFQQLVLVRGDLPLICLIHRAVQQTDNDDKQEQN